MSFLMQQARRTWHKKWFSNFLPLQRVYGSSRSHMFYKVDKNGKLKMRARMRAHALLSLNEYIYNKCYSL